MRFVIRSEWRDGEWFTQCDSNGDGVENIPGEDRMVTVVEGLACLSTAVDKLILTLFSANNIPVETGMKALRLAREVLPFTTTRLPPRVPIGAAGDN